jgi:hypothetical protein
MKTDKKKPAHGAQNATKVAAASKGMPKSTVKAKVTVTAKQKTPMHGMNAPAKIAAARKKAGYGK